MKFVRNLVYVAVVGFGLMVGTAQEASAYTWGWQKPLNQKAGSAFYTSNRHFYKNGWQSRTYQPRYTTRTVQRSVYRQPVRRTSTRFGWWR